MKIFYKTIIVLFFSVAAESKDIKMIFFYETLNNNNDGKIITDNNAVNIKKIDYENIEKKYWWHFSDPLFFGKEYIVIKHYRYWAKNPYYDDYSIQILDENFNFKEELFQVRNKIINNVVYNPSKKIIAFSLKEISEGEIWISKTFFLNLYDLKKKKIILSKKMGGYLDNIYFNTRAFNTTGDYICFCKFTTKKLPKKGTFEGTMSQDFKVMIYDITNDEEYFIHEGSNPSFVTDNQLAYVYEGLLYLYDLKTKKSEKYFSSRLLENIHYYFISPDNKRIIICYTNKYKAVSKRKKVMYNFVTKEEIKWDLLKEIDSQLTHIDWQFVE